MTLKAFPTHEQQNVESGREKEKEKRELFELSLFLLLHIPCLSWGNEIIANTECLGLIVERLHPRWQSSGQTCLMLPTFGIVYKIINNL